MARQAAAKQQDTWQGLNKRQRDYLTAIYHADQEVEAEERSRWNRGGRPRPAVEWRWMIYATLDGHDTPVKRHLKATNQIDPGTGSTLEALEQRKLINVRYDITTYQGREILSNEPIPAIQITKAGPALARQALALRGGLSVAGTLQEWHWRALSLAYAAREGKGIALESGYYGHIGWKTWLRLRDYTPAPLIQEYHEERGHPPSTGSPLTDYYVQIMVNTLRSRRIWPANVEDCPQSWKLGHTPGQNRSPSDFSQRNLVNWRKKEKPRMRKATNALAFLILFYRVRTSPA